MPSFQIIEFIKGYVFKLIFKVSITFHLIYFLCNVLDKSFPNIFEFEEAVSKIASKPMVFRAIWHILRFNNVSVVILPKPHRRIIPAFIIINPVILMVRAIIVIDEGQLNDFNFPFSQGVPLALHAFAVKAFLTVRIPYITSSFRSSIQS